MKALVNKWLKRFGVELHGVGYLEKLSRTSFRNDSFSVVQHLLSRTSPKSIFDVGANYGEMAAMYHTTFPLAKVYCYEPTPSIFESLKQRFQDVPQIELIKAGLGETNCTKTFFENHSGNTNSFLKSAKIGATSDKQCETLGQIEVEMRALDDEVKRLGVEEIDFMKLDVQGYEYFVLQGAAKTLAAGSVNVILSEVYFKRQYEGQPLFWDIAGLLAQHGFELVDLYDLYYGPNQLLWGDAIFASSKVLNS